MSERAHIARHAGTVLTGQLAVMAFGVVDTVVAGRYSGEALAALAVGHAAFITVFIGLTGLLQALLPIWAELHGAGKAPEVGRSARQALYLAGLASLAGILALLFPGPLLNWTGVPADMQGDVRAYMAILTLALPPALLFRMYGTLSQALGQPRMVTWLQIASLGVKLPLTIWLAFGGLGLPALGAAGCAWATVVVHLLQVGLALWLLRSQPAFAPYAFWRPLEAPDWRAIAQFARLGVPAALALMVEVTSFTLMALFIARQGTVAAAAHQVAANMAAVMYMVPLSIAIATSARVSFWMGAGDLRQARAALRTGLRMGLLLSLSLSALLLGIRHELAALYAADAQVAAIAAGLLAWLAVFHVGDAVQALCVFLLRCWRVTVAPLVAYSVLLWGVGLTGGFMLAYRGIGGWPPLHSPAAFWIASSCALAALAVILPLILWRAVRSSR